VAYVDGHRKAVDTEALIPRGLVARRGVGILLVEHDIALVSRVCEHLYVLDFGIILASGATAEGLHDAAVRTAYLGELL